MQTSSSKFRFSMIFERLVCFGCLRTQIKVEEMLIAFKAMSGGLVDRKNGSIAQARGAAPLSNYGNNAVNVTIHTFRSTR